MMGRSMHKHRVDRTAVRDALIALLGNQKEPVSARDLVTAVYHYTEDDHVGLMNVAPELRRLAAEGKARKTASGMWVGVPS